MCKRPLVLFIQEGIANGWGRVHFIIRFPHSPLELPKLAFAGSSPVTRSIGETGRSPHAEAALFLATKGDKRSLLLATFTVPAPCALCVVRARPFAGPLGIAVSHDMLEDEASRRGLVPFRPHIMGQARFGQIQIRLDKGWRNCGMWE